MATRSSSSAAWPGAVLYRRPADGRDAEDVVTPTPAVQYAGSVSPDGVTLVFGQYDPMTGADIWTVTMPRTGAGATTPAPPQPFVKTKFTELAPRFSPDGRWIAYQSNESGRFEINIRSFPDGGRTVQLTTDGGIAPVWMPSGHEILYRGTDNKMKSLTLDAASGAPTGKPRVLFDAAGYEDAFGDRARRQAATDDAADPQRALGDADSRRAELPLGAAPARQVRDGHAGSEGAAAASRRRNLRETTAAA